MMKNFAVAVVRSVQDLELLQHSAVGRVQVPLSFVDHLLAIPKTASTTTSDPLEDGLRPGLQPRGGGCDFS